MSLYTLIKVVNFLLAKSIFDTPYEVDSKYKHSIEFIKTNGFKSVRLIC